MRRGLVFRRCGACNRRIPADARRCVGRPEKPGCGHKAYSWAYVVDTNPPGAPRRQRMRAGFRTKEQALAAMGEVQADAKKGTLVEPSRQTVREYLTAWLESIRPPTIRPGTWQSYREHVEVYIAPRIGDVPLQSLTRAAVKALYAELASSGRRRGPGGLAPKTVGNIHITLRRALAVAVEDGLLARNPAAGAYRIPADASVERETWTEDLLRRFLHFVRADRLFALWRLIAYTGIRRGEALALRWPSLDLAAATLTINRQRAKGEDGKVFEGAPKSERGRRTIDVDPKTVQALREHRKRQMEERLAWGEGYVDEGYVFAREDGRPYHPDAISDRFEALCRAAGVPALGLHAALRHLHGSILLRQGVPLHVVSRRLGHADDAFTSRVYAHILPQQGAEAAAAFAAAIDDEKLQDDSEEDAR